MRFRSSVTLLLIGASLAAVTTGCRKKVAVAPAPPRVQEIAPPLPSAPTASLSVEPGTIEPGQAATLRWSSTDATEATLSGIGKVTIEGKQDVQPATSTTYELVVTGPGGTATASATVTVVAPPPPILPPPPADHGSLLSRLEAEVSDLYFDYDKSDVRADARAALEKDAIALRSILADFPDSVIVLEGHCDERGSAEYNLGLGEQRAVSVSAYLEALGVSSERLHRISYGKERPQCSESTEACWQLNRRVHFSASGVATN